MWTQSFQAAPALSLELLSVSFITYLHKELHNGDMVRYAFGSLGKLSFITLFTKGAFLNLNQRLIVMGCRAALLTSNTISVSVT